MTCLPVDAILVNTVLEFARDLDMLREQKARNTRKFVGNIAELDEFVGSLHVKPVDHFNYALCPANCRGLLHCPCPKILVKFHF